MADEIKTIETDKLATNKTVRGKNALFCKSLFDSLVSRIERGDLKEGDRLPPLRKFAEDKGISLRGARSIFGQLDKIGFVRCIQGNGTYISSSRRGIQPSTGLSKEVYIILQTHPYITSSFLRPFINELQNCGYIAVVVVEHPAEDQKEEFIKLLEKKWTDSPPAAIVMEGQSERIDRLVRRSIHPYTKVIATFRHSELVYPSWHSVQLDIAGAHYFATKRLLKEGHRKIGIALKKQIIKPDSPSIPDRSQLINLLCVNGASSAVEDFGLNNVIETISFERAKNMEDDSEHSEIEDKIIQETVQWLEKHDYVTAIIGQEPWLWYVKIAASLLKKRIPEDLAIIGIGRANPAYKGEYPCFDWCLKKVVKEVIRIIASDNDELEDITRHILVPAIWVDKKVWVNDLVDVLVH